MPLIKLVWTSSRDFDDNDIRQIVKETEWATIPNDELLFLRENLRFIEASANRSFGERLCLVEKEEMRVSQLIERAVSYKEKLAKDAEARARATEKAKKERDKKKAANKRKQYEKLKAEFGE